MGQLPEGRLPSIWQSEVVAGVLLHQCCLVKVALLVSVQVKRGNARMPHGLQCWHLRSSRSRRRAGGRGTPRKEETPSLCGRREGQCCVIMKQARRALERPPRGRRLLSRRLALEGVWPGLARLGDIVSVRVRLFVACLFVRCGQKLTVKSPPISSAIASLSCKQRLPVAACSHSHRPQRTLLFVRRLSTSAFEVPTIGSCANLGRPATFCLLTAA